MKKRAPVVIDLEPAPKTAAPRRRAQTTDPLPDPSKAPPVPEPDVAAAVPSPRAAQSALSIAVARPSRLWRVFFWVVGLIAGAMLSNALWSFAEGMAARHLWLGYAAWGALALLVLLLVLLILRELGALSRMRRVDALRHQAIAARDGSVAQAQALSADMRRFFRGRKDMTWGFQEYDAKAANLLDSDAIVDALERTTMPALDARAQDAVIGAARQVGVATAFVPLAMVDVVVALAANLRMIRSVAEIYGGRTGTFGSWRLVRAVAMHLLATGAMAVGDDMIGSVAGGGVLSKLSRRFGEGLVNGALTARVGVAAMEICRPVPFHAIKRPSVSNLVGRALGGAFQRTDSPE